MPIPIARVLSASEQAVTDIMARNSAREGRRRRVLNEELLTGGSNRGAASDGSLSQPGDTPRYGAGANVENHPQITDYVPRRFRTFALVILVALGMGWSAQILVHYAPEICRRIEVFSPEEFISSFCDRIVAWTSAAVLLVTAVYARILFGLRRHRVDDSRGRYRLWRLAGWAAILLSFNTVVEGHTLASQALGHLSGWQLLPGSVGWWLIPAGVVGGWLLVKLSYDASESRSALLAYFLAMGCFAAAAAVTLEWVPPALASHVDLLSRTLPLTGYVMLLAGTLLMARYVVLDVQGLIDHPVEKTAHVGSCDPAPAQAEGAASSSRQDGGEPSDGQVTAWTDGSQAEGEDLPPKQRRLSKAERKRLRKQNRNRAA